MKILALEVTALGPFAGHERIDFSRFDESSILLISGPIGAGKTTLLDALCFALFGESSGGEREAEELRCSYAEPTTLTCVVLDFQLGTKRYRVERRPEQRRPKRRGTGTTLEAQSATLWDQTRAGPGEEGPVLASGVFLVTAQIEALFGFGAHQFRKVVLLPQGQFRTLLAAESKEKEAILERLFDTQIFGAIAEALGEELKALARRIQNEETAMEALLLEEADSFSDRAALERHLVQQEALYAAGQKVVPEAKSLSTQAGAELEAGRVARVRLEERSDAARSLESLESKAREVQATAELLTRARRAAEIQVFERARFQDLPDLPQALSRHAAQQKKLRESEAERAFSELRWAEADRANADLLEQRNRVAVLRAAVADAERIEAQKAQHLAAERRVEECLAKAELANSAWSLLEERRKALEQRQAFVVLEANDRSSRELEVSKLGALLEKKSRLEGLLVSLKRARAEVEAGERRLHEIEETSLAGREILATVEADFLRGQAALFALELGPLKACPVCGSKTHPHPAEGGGRVPAEAELLQLKSQNGVRTREVEEQRASLLGLRTQEQDLRAKKSALEEELQGDRAEISKTQLKVAEAKVLAARRAEDEQQTNRAALLALEDPLTRSRAELEASRDLLQSALLLRAAREAAWKERARDLTQDLGSPGQIAGQLEDLEAQITRDVARVQEAERVRREATENQRLQARLAEGLLERTDQAQDRVRHAQLELADLCERSGFADLEAYQKVQPLIAQIPSMEAKIKNHGEALAAARERKHRADELAKGMVEPDLERLAVAAERAALAHEAAVAEDARLLAQVERTRRVLTIHAERSAAIEQLEASYSALGVLAKAARGHPPYAVSFQRYVLGSVFDQVLFAASERLARMSRNRYRLERAPVQAGALSRPGGLDLLVTDNYTGLPRNVATLSGGESFLAALALALGLADVVQASAGGIRLETLFIDEGFGALDNDALDLALDALATLEGPGRLIGIISHVAELRSRIPARLDVIPGDGGSHTRSSVGDREAFELVPAGRVEIE